MLTPIERFATYILKKPLYPYQAEIANAILHSIEHGYGDIITVMLSRQAGKNQLSAVLEAFLLFTRTSGTIVKAAPTFTPQITNSRLRLMSLLENPYTRDRIWTSWGMIGLAPSREKGMVRRHVGPRVAFFSAEPTSNVVGATADMLMEIDEAQDVNIEKFNRDFSPMRSTTNATTVFYGTAWSDDTLLALQRAHNMEIQERDQRRRHFEFDWRTPASINPNYKKFVESEIARLGEDHIAIQTQYFLHAISGAGYFFNPLQRQLLQGSHIWEDEPREGETYIAGLDIGGEERQDPDDPLKLSTKRDATVLTIGRTSYNELNLPQIEVIHHEMWTGRSHVEQYAAIAELMEHWSIQRIVPDATGVGEGLASLLLEKFGEDRVTWFKFTRPSKSKLGYQLLELINGRRLQLYAAYGAPREMYSEVWQQIRKTRYRLPAAEIIDFYVEPGEGHDDFVTSLALLTEAMESISPPAVATFIKPVRLYSDESRF